MSEIKRRTAAITLALVSNNHLVRQGLQRIMETERHIRLIGQQAASGVKAEEVIAQEQPQVVIIEMEPEIDVNELIRKTKASVPNAKIILLSGVDDHKSSRQALTGAVDGIVLKVQPVAVLVAAIKSVCQSPAGTVQLEDDQIDHVQSNGMSTLNSTQALTLKWPAGLTERERAVIALIGQGLSNKEIATRLCVSDITVRHHLTSIFDKLGVTSRQMLLIRAHQYGLVELKAPP
jgi:DNA-binding NarL/FixJ family response regulator